MYRALSTGLLSAFVGLGFASVAHATEVERSGNVFHKRVCAPVVGHAASCHAHVVTDSKGRLIFKCQGAGWRLWPQPICATPTRSPATAVRPPSSPSSMPMAITMRKPILAFIAPISGFRPAQPPMAVSASTTRTASRATIRTEYRLGPGIRARSRYGERHVPGLQDLFG